MEEIVEKAKHFFEVAKEVNFDVVALYAKEPQMMQILGGVVVVLVLIVIAIIKSKMKHAGAQKALQNLESYLESFEEYQQNLRKILKTIKGAKGEFLESLKAKKEDYYTEQLRTLRDLPLEEKIDKYQEMASLYAQLAKATRDEELREFYEQKAEEILEKELLESISEYMKDFSFTPEDVTVLEKIVAYANTKEDSEPVLSIVMEKLQGIDFGSNLERYTFVQNLDAEKLGEIATYCAEQQQKLFEDGERVVAAEVLEYLLENDEKERVLSYIKSLKVPTHLQELYYRFFDQKGLEELDFAFIANPLEINQAYAKYIENLVTDKWRDEKALEKLLENENFADVVGHDRVRLIIERIDELRKEEVEHEKLEEALRLAKEAHAMALETKTLMAAKEPKEVEEKRVDAAD
jgi:hypothetical protein